MSTLEETAALCAGCGKGGGDGLKKCSGCKEVEYCSKDCQRSHWPKHKQDCKRRRCDAELQTTQALASEAIKRSMNISDDELFQDPPPREDCPICFLPLPLESNYSAYHICCGKMICRGCAFASTAANNFTPPDCPFCRTPWICDTGDSVKAMKKRVGANDPNALNNFGGWYLYGQCGMPQDYKMAESLWLRGGELGCGGAYINIGNIYRKGQGTTIDMQKAKYYYQLAAILGEVLARHRLGLIELHSGNKRRALKHFMIAARCGCDVSLHIIKQTYQNASKSINMTWTNFFVDFVSKDEFEQVLRAHKNSRDEMKSDHRESAARITPTSHVTDHTTFQI